MVVSIFHLYSLWSKFFCHKNGCIIFKIMFLVPPSPDFKWEPLGSCFGAALQSETECGELRTYEITRITINFFHYPNLFIFTIIFFTPYIVACFFNNKLYLHLQARRRAHVGYDGRKSRGASIPHNIFLSHLKYLDV